MTNLFYFVPIAALAALFFAWLFFRQMMKESEGTATMKEIALYVRKGAMAYLKQQYKVVTIVFVIIAAFFAVLAYGFGVQNRLSLYFPDFNTVEIKTADFYLRRHGRPALRLECPGTFQFQEGRYRGEWQLRYLNEQFLKLFSPTLAREAQLTGKVQVTAQNHFEAFRAAVALECSRWLAATREELPCNGRLLAVFESSPRQWAVRNFQLKFNRAELPLADFTGECRVDRFQEDGPVAVRLSSGGFSPRGRGCQRGSCTEYRITHRRPGRPVCPCRSRSK